MAEKGVHFPSEMEHRKDVVGTLAVREGMSGLEDSTLSEDSSVFTLLFQQCVKPGETSVDINVLVEFIQRLRLGEGKEGEEVFDSHDSSGSGGMSFNLETLQKMLECACDQNRKIEKEAYLHIIKSWVKHVRETTGNMTQSPQQMAIVDSPSSDMPEMDRDISYGSYHDSRTSDSSVQSARHEAEETISRLQYEIKSLNEQNKSLMRQYDGSEESLKEYQARNTMLQAKLDEAMSNLAKLKELEFVNKDLSMMLSETKSMNEDLVRAKERLNREMDRMKNDYDNLEVTLSTTRLERDQLMDQLRSTQAVLTLTKEEEKESRTELEVKLNESRSQIVLMQTNLDEVDFRNSELKNTIRDLEGQLQHLSMDQMVTSTTFRMSNKAVSILEEIVDQEAEAAEEGGGMYSSGEESSSRSISPREGEDNVRRYRHVEVHESPEVEQFKERVNVKEHRKDVVGTLAMREGMSGLEDSTLSEDSSVLTLLFQQCVKPGETSVDINVIVEFIQRLRLGERKEGEEVFDSHDSSCSGGMSFNLETLQKKLECACDQNWKIEKEAYLRIIKSWVKHVRETTGNMTQSPQQMAIVDSPSSDMPEMERDILYGSYHDSRRQATRVSRVPVMKRSGCLASFLIPSSYLSSWFSYFSFLCYPSYLMMLWSGAVPSVLIPRYTFSILPSSLICSS